MFVIITELWLSWIEDERNLASSPEEKQHVQELFERALRDYLCKLHYHLQLLYVICSEFNHLFAFSCRHLVGIRAI